MSGGDEFAKYARDVAAAADALDDKAEDLEDLIGLGALATARARAPVDEGDIVSGLRLRRDGGRATVEGTTDHDFYQEYGTSSMPAQPFIGPAFEEWEPRLISGVEKIRDDTVRGL